MSIPRFAAAAARIPAPSSPTRTAHSGNYGRRRRLHFSLYFRISQRRPPRYPISLYTFVVLYDLSATIWLNNLGGMIELVFRAMIDIQCTAFITYMVLC
jgi:antibiotic biosynthesis monooxygenase (ABM) superfamily enzyme